VHHMPAGPPPSSRIAAALGRCVSVLLRALGLRRVLPVFAVVLAVTGIAFAVPVVSNVVTSSSERAALESAAAAGASSSSAGRSDRTSSAPSTSGSDTVQMGVDGAPAGEAPAESPAPPEAPAAGESEEAAPVAAADESTPAPEPAAAATPEPEETPERSAPTASPAPAPAPAPAPRATSAPAPAPAPRTAPAAPAAPGTEGQVLTLVNQARASAGCAPLVADSALAAVARAHSADMRDRDYFAHDTPEGLSPFDRAERAGVGYARAENIAYGQRDAAAVMEDWMDSSGHRANILDCKLTKLGVGVAEGPGGPWWTQLFGV
jgi:uncharacterized protein YkwD